MLENVSLTETLKEFGITPCVDARRIGSEADAVCNDSTESDAVNDIIIDARLKAFTLAKELLLTKGPIINLSSITTKRGGSKVSSKEYGVAVCSRYILLVRIDLNSRSFFL